MSVKFESNYDDFDPEMTDDAIWDMLNLYADGEATPEEAAQIEILLNSDASLQSDLAFLRLNTEIVSLIDAVEPPASLRDSILTATIYRPTLSRRLATAWGSLREAFVPRYGRYVLATGTLAAAGLLMVSLRHRAPESVLPPVHVAINSVPNRVTVPDNAISSPAQYTGSAVKNTIASSKPTKSTTSDENAPHRYVNREKSASSVVEVAKNVEQPEKTTRQLVKSDASPVRKNGVGNSGEAIKHVQNPRKVETDTKTAVAVAEYDYSRRPMMDADNQRPSTPIMQTASLTEPDIRTDDGEAPTIKVAVASETETTQTKVPTNRRYGKLLVAPPDPRRIMTTAAMRRMSDAASMGYSKATVESIQRNQPSVSFFGRF